LKHEIDTGGIIFQEKEPISENDDAGSLYVRLMEKGARLVLKTVKAIEGGSHPNSPQPEASELKHAPKIFKETCEINWTQTSRQVFNFVRGLSPYPGAWTTIGGKTYKIYRVTPPLPGQAQHPTPSTQHPKPGSTNTDNSTYLHISASDGWVAIEELQAEGKKKMGIRKFLMGNKI
ncbi:MAG TPA: hypothetical protein VG737_04820, partial [Cyclobacteriaceae bacterium]|nr:hypothetical protein [Cyclobacteriaceae bacterium]